MKVSQMLNPTLREAPAEAEIMSHKLMFRAGLIRKVAAGIYTYLPLGWRTVRKIEQIVREEMDRAGGQELMLPIVQPAELWQQTGRWDVYGPEMFRLQDRHGRRFCLGPTHEEIITDLVRAEVRSYKQLPLLLYQIQNKYRDERRPRFGLMRGREFIMKDLYSFDRDAAESAVSYQKMYEAYTRIFRRCGLNFRAVEADQGAIGGTGGSHEFMALADSGEATVVFCPACTYSANVERAECQDPAVEAEEVSSGTPVPAYNELATPGVRSIDQLAAFCATASRNLTKALVCTADDKVLLVAIRGDQELNEVKLRNALAPAFGPSVMLTFTPPEQVRTIFGCEPGSLGPIGLPPGMLLIADPTVMTMASTICGANKNDAHFQNVVPNRDFKPDLVADLRQVGEGDLCPHCGSPLSAARGIEVGQVFNLGKKYSESLKATYLDDQGKEQYCHMGCYGIGVTRTMAAVVEQSSDENGIIWPMAIAPYQCVVVPVAMKDADICRLSLRIYEDLQAAGLEIVYDDRDERPGVKFKDADLVGYPLRIIVGKKAMETGKAELVVRRTGSIELIATSEIAARVQEHIAAELRGN